MYSKEDEVKYDENVYINRSKNTLSQSFIRRFRSFIGKTVNSSNVKKLVLKRPFPLFNTAPEEIRSLFSKGELGTV